MNTVEKLKLIRKYYKLSQAEMASRLGTSRSNYTNIELGRVAPTQMFLICVSAVYNVEQDWLLDDKNEDTNVAEHVIDREILEKYGELNGNYRAFAEKQLDQLLELQKSEENGIENPND